MLTSQDKNVKEIISDLHHAASDRSNRLQQIAAIDKAIAFLYALSTDLTALASSAIDTGDSHSSDGVIGKDGVTYPDTPLGRAYAGIKTSPSEAIPADVLAMKEACKRAVSECLNQYGRMTFVTEKGWSGLEGQILAAIDKLSPEGKADASPPDWKQDQAETTRIKPPATVEGGRGEPVAWRWQAEGWGDYWIYNPEPGWLAEQNNIVKQPLYTAPPSDAGMREALENVRGFLDTPVGRRRFVGDPFYDEVIASIRKALPAPGATTKPSIPVLGAESVSGAHVADRTGGANPPTGANSDGYDVRFHENVLGQLGATTKSDGGGGRARDFSTVAIDENFYFTWPKDGANEVPVQDSGGTQGKSNAALVASVDANANDDGQRVQTGNNVVTGGESATTNSSPSEPKNYFFENEEDAAEAADNGRNTGGKSYYRPSDPSSTRSEVSVEELADFLDHLDVLRIAGSANDDEAELARALLDQFEIRRK